MNIAREERIKMMKRGRKRRKIKRTMKPKLKLQERRV